MKNLRRELGEPIAIFLMAEMRENLGHSLWKSFPEVTQDLAHPEHGSSFSFFTVHADIHVVLNKNCYSRGTPSGTL